MVQKHIIVSMIAFVAISGILIMAILANQAYASSKSESSSSEKCKTTENENSQGEENCKTAQGENTQGGKVAEESSSNNGKVAEEKSNNGKVAEESSNTGKVAQESNNSTKTFKNFIFNWLQSSVPKKPATPNEVTTTTQQLHRPTTTLTPIQVTNEGHKIETTTQQLSNNGKLDVKVAEKPGQVLFPNSGLQWSTFDPERETCEGSVQSIQGHVGNVEVKGLQCSGKIFKGAEAGTTYTNEVCQHSSSGIGKVCSVKVLKSPIVASAADTSGSRVTPFPSPPTSKFPDLRLQFNPGTQDCAKSWDAHKGGGTGGVVKMVEGRAFCMEGKIFDKVSSTSEMPGRGSFTH
jgi:hypothetical protein